ncbi:MAG: hypothetical protein ABI114_06745 [Rhodanobacter sp.]
MRQIYTSAHADNIARVTKMMADHGIETSVLNQSRYDRPTWQRASYLPQREDRDSWPQVWVVRPDDYTEARLLMRDVGVEPIIVHGEELAASRQSTPVQKRRHTVARIRHLVLLAVLAVTALIALRYMGVF